MFRNYFLINLLLIMMISVLGIKFYNVATHRVVMPSAMPDQEKQTSVSSVKFAERPVNVAEYDVISKLDLFRPSRSPAEKKESRVEKGPPKNPPKLFGTIIFNDLKTAILEDPDTKTTKNYSVNETIAGYVIADIFEDKVSLTRDGESFEVKLREDKGVAAPKRRTVAQQPNQASTPIVTPSRQRRPQRTRRAVPPRTARQRVPAAQAPKSETDNPEQAPDQEQTEE